MRPLLTRGFPEPGGALPSRRTPLVMLGALTAFGPLAFDMYLPALPALARDLHTGDTGAQLSLSMTMIGLGLGQLVVGPLSDHTGRRRPLLLGVLVFAVASLVCALAPNLPVLLVARLACGIGGGAGAVIARSMVRDLFSGADAAHAFGVTALVFGVTPVLAPIVGSLVAPWLGWRGIFVVIACCGAILLATASRLPETLPVEKRHDAGIGTLFHAFPTVLSDRSFLAPALALGIGFQPLSLYLAMSSLAMQHGYGLSVRQFGTIFAANSVGILLLGRLNLRLVGRVGSARMLTATLVLSAVSCLTLAAATRAHAPLPLVLVPLFLAISVAGPLVPNATALALEHQTGAVGAAAACLGLVQSLMGALIPPTVSLLGVTPVLMATSMAVASLLAFAPLLAVPRQPRP